MLRYGLWEELLKLWESSEIGDLKGLIDPQSSNRDFVNARDAILEFGGKVVSAFPEMRNAVRKWTSDLFSVRIFPDCDCNCETLAGLITALLTFEYLSKEDLIRAAARLKKRRWEDE
jgi:hypothetical protein